MDHLPIEIKTHIFDKCSDKTKRVARLCCTKWFSIIDYRDFTLYLTTKSSWSSIVDRLSQYNKPITLKFRKNVLKRSKEINDGLAKLANLTMVEYDQLDEDFSDDVWFKLTALTNLQAISFKNVSLRREVPLEPLLSFRHLTKLGVGSTELPLERVAASLQHLTNLAWCSLFSSKQCDVNIFQHYHTKLTSLFVSVELSARTAETWFEPLCNLKQLTFCAMKLDAAISLKALTALESLEFYKDFRDLNSSCLTGLLISRAHERLMEQSLEKLVNLKQLEFRMGLSDRGGVCTYQWLTALTRLETLCLFPMEHHSLSYAASTLTRLNVVVGPYYALVLDHLSKFASLLDLRLETLDSLSSIAVLSTLTKLHSLQLITREDDTVDVDFLPRMSDLTRLQLSNVKSAHIAHLPHLAHLELVYAEGCCTGFNGLPNLTHLKVQQNGENKPRDVSFVRTLTALQRLELNARQLLRCSFFSALTALQSLSVRNVLSDYHCLAHLTHLTALKIDLAVESRNLLELPTSLQELTAQFLLSKRAVPEIVYEDVFERLPNLYLTNISFV